MNKPDRKIITVEEPVEYQMNGINQVQVNTDIGMTFPAALRSILRQAPNIIMIGEIRTWRRPRSRRTPASPAILSSARCTRMTHPRPSRVSSISGCSRFSSRHRPRDHGATSR
jgi:hypothetical protein